MELLLKQIEKARQKMHECTEWYGLNAQQVLEQSRKLDDLLNSYYHMKVRKSA